MHLVIFGHINTPRWIYFHRLTVALTKTCLPAKVSTQKNIIYLTFRQSV